MIGLVWLSSYLYVPLICICPLEEEEVGWDAFDRWVHNPHASYDQLWCVVDVPQNCCPRCTRLILLNGPSRVAVLWDLGEL